MKLKLSAFWTVVVVGLATVLGLLDSAPAQTKTRRGVRQTQGDGLGLGDSAPRSNHKMRNTDESQVSIADVLGERGALVVYTCNHCPWAKAWEARITRLANYYRERGIGAIALNPNNPETFAEDRFEVMQQRARAAGMKFPYVVDEGAVMATAFGAKKTPEAYLFDEDLKLVYHGAVDDNPFEVDKVQNHFLRDALRARVRGRPVRHPISRAIGCGVKH